MFSPLANFAHTFYRLDRGLEKFAVVADRNISALLEFECRVLVDMKQSEICGHLLR